MVPFHSDGLLPIQPDLIHQLPLLPNPESGDLLVHWHGADQLQMFLSEGRSEGMDWTQIQPGHRHPHLSTHRLHIGNSGPPSWVKGATITTYNGPARRNSTKPRGR
jgi:hypothetical protein